VRNFSISIFSCSQATADGFFHQAHMAVIASRTGAIFISGT